MSNLPHGISVSAPDQHYVTRKTSSLDRLGLKNPAFWYSGGFLALFAWRYTMVNCLPQ